MSDEFSFPPFLELPPDARKALKQHLIGEIAHRSNERRTAPWARGPKLAGVAVACTTVAAALSAVFILESGSTAKTVTGTTSAIGRTSPGLLPGSLPTVAHPFSALLGPKQITLAAGQSALGPSLALPQTAAVGPSDAGPVWIASQSQQGGATTTAVAVTFPAQGMIMMYINPAPSDGSAAHFQSMTQSMPSRNGGSEGQVITLPGGVPALAVQENSDDLATNFGEIIFNVAGTEVRVMGHNDEATLQGIAESILNRSSS